MDSTAPKFDPDRSDGHREILVGVCFRGQACRNGYDVYYTTATQLFENLVLAQADGSLPKLRRSLVKTPLLVIDDYQQSLQGALLITSQFPPGKWYDLFNDPTVADAILDRIVRRAHFIELKGESMRKLKGKK